MLELKDINIKLGDFELKNVNLKIEKGDYFVILGLSGAGKSIMLESIAGLQSPDTGKIKLEGKNIIKHKIQNRPVGLVFQDHAVFPHMSVYDNIAYSLKKKLKKSELHKKVEETATLTNINHLLDRDPQTLSGGEKQRVALARTLIREPKILLLDEPLASLDVQLRSGLRALLRKLNRMGQTIIHVTHEYEEAISLASKIAVFQDGEIVQQGDPYEVFKNPVNEFVARFRGVKNFFKVKMIAKERVLLPNNIRMTILPQEEISEGFLMFKSEDVIISLEDQECSACNKFKGIITDIIPSFRGNEIIVDAGISISSFITHQSLKNLDLKMNDEVFLVLKAAVIKYLPHRIN